MPKLIKPKKDKSAEKKPKKVKEKKVKPVKVKQKKEKTKKAPRVKGTSPFPKNKKALIILVAALILVIVGAAATIILLTLLKKGDTEEKAAVAPAYYFSKKEEISSVTEIVGERDFEMETAPAEDQTQTSESQEQETEESQDAQEKESSGEAAAEPVLQEERYRYFNIEDVSADLTSYRTYLEDQKNFIDVTEKKETSESEEKDSQVDDTEFYQLAGPAKDSETYLSITLESKPGSYTVTVSTENQPWNTYLKDVWNQQKKKLEDYKKKPATTNTTSRGQAEDAVRSQSQEKLKLPEAIDTYEYIVAPGMLIIDGKDYYTVRAYKRKADDTLAYVASYLFDCSSKSVTFQYNESTGETTPLN